MRKDHFNSPLAAQGFTKVTHVLGRGTCAVKQFALTSALCHDIDNEGLQKGRWCYHTTYEAEMALVMWDGKGDPPGNWIKYKSPFKEYSNPNYKDQ